MSTALSPRHLLLADFASSDKRVHARLRQSLSSAIHAKAKRLGFNTVLTTMTLVIVGAGTLHGLAISVLSRSPAD